MCVCGRMGGFSSTIRCVLLLCIVWWSLCVELTQCNVVYDKKALVIDGQRRILFSGSIHYPRSTPEVLYFLLISFGISFAIFSNQMWLIYAKFSITLLIMGHDT